MKRIVLSSFRFLVRHRAHPGSKEASNEGARNRHTYAFRVRPVKALPIMRFRVTPRDGLLDELSLVIDPIGSGMRLFDEMADQVRFKLVDSRTFSTGAVGVTYQRASA